MSCNHKSTLASMLCWRCQGKEMSKKQLRSKSVVRRLKAQGMSKMDILRNTEPIMTDDTHCFDCGCLLDECECEEPVERGKDKG